MEIERFAIDVIKADAIKDMHKAFNAKSQSDIIAANNGFMKFCMDVLYLDLIPEHLYGYLQSTACKVHQIALSLIKSL